MAIDFMAGIRGHRQAKRDQFEDFQKEVVREKLMQDMRDKVINRQSQRYLSTINTNRQDAIAGGMAPDQYLTRQLEAIQGDQGFRSLDPQAQSQVLSGLQTRALSQIKDLHDQGMIERANQMASAFGVGTGRVFTPAQQATMAGDLPGMLGAINEQYGSQYVLDDDGTVNINGVRVPATYLQSAFASSGASPLSIVNAANEYAQAQEKEKQQWDQIRRLVFAQTRGKTDIGEFGSSPNYSQVPVGQDQVGVPNADGGVLNEGMGAVNEAGYGPPRNLASDAVLDGTVPTQPGMLLGDTQNPTGVDLEALRVPLPNLPQMTGPGQEGLYNPPEQDMRAARQLKSLLTEQGEGLRDQLAGLNPLSPQARPILEALEKIDERLVKVDGYLQQAGFRQEFTRQDEESSKNISPADAVKVLTQLGPERVRDMIRRIEVLSPGPNRNEFGMQTALKQQRALANADALKQALTNAGYEL